MIEFIRNLFRGPSLSTSRAPRSLSVRFDAAKQEDLFADWVVTPITSDEQLRKQWLRLVVRAREAAENNDYVRRYLKQRRNNVIGPQGFTFQAKTLRRNGEQDTIANAAIEKHYKLWCRNVSVGKKMSFREACILFDRTLAVDGEVIVRRVRSSRFNSYGLSLQFIDPVMLDINYNITKKGGNTIRMGIELNEWGAPVAYHFQSDENHAESYSYAGRHYVRVPSEDIIHAFEMERVGQKRGVTMFASGLRRQKMLDGYEEAALVNARAGASKMGFLEQTGDAEEYSGDDVDEDGNDINELDPGTIEKLPRGWKFSNFNPDYPTAQFGPFVQTNLRAWAGGRGISYHTLANDLSGVSYSSGRIGTLDDRDEWKTCQAFDIEHFGHPVYEWWISAVLTDRVPIIGTAPLGLENPEKYRDVVIKGRTWTWVDPAKDTAADETLVQNRMDSISDIIRERGKDPDEVFEEIAMEREKLKKLGIPIDQKPAKQAGSSFQGGENADT